MTLWHKWNTSLQTVNKMVQVGAVLHMVQACKEQSPWTHVPAALRLQGHQAQGWLRPPCATPPLLASALHRRIGTQVWPASCMHLLPGWTCVKLGLAGYGCTAASSMIQQWQKQRSPSLWHCCTHAWRYAYNRDWHAEHARRQPSSLSVSANHVGRVLLESFACCSKPHVGFAATWYRRPGITMFCLVLCAYLATCFQLASLSRTETYTD